MADLIFYEQVASLDKAKHQKLKLRQPVSMEFARKTNSIPLVAAEFVDAGREFPIVFIKGADNVFMPVLLVGFRNDENLFVKEDGRWDARFVPGFIRRYPFAPADVGDGQMVLCIDEKAACLNEEEGLPLFGESDSTPLIKDVLGFLQSYQDAAVRTQAFCKELGEANLLVETNAQFRQADGTDLKLSGVYLVDQNRLQVLGSEKVLAFFNSGALALIYAHLNSLGNLNALIERLAPLLAH